MAMEDQRITIARLKCCTGFARCRIYDHQGSRNQNSNSWRPSVFFAPDRQAVDAFYAAALAGGGHDGGAPGLRPRYHADYYCAFVLDPDGHRIEAVCHAPASPSIVPVG